MKLFAVLWAVAALGAAAAEPSPPGPLPVPGQGQVRGQGQVQARQPVLGQGLVPGQGLDQPQVHGQGPGSDPGLRQAVQNFLRLEPSAPPRQLNPAERAELRRQLNEFGHRPERRPTHPETR